MAGSEDQAAVTIDPAQWVDRHGDTLFRYALVRLRDPGEAEEVVQETFLAALRACDQYSGKGSEGAWLMGILKRKVVDHIRRCHRPDSPGEAGASIDPVESAFDSKGNWRMDPRIAGVRPESRLEAGEFWQTLRHCLDHLPQRQAEVFTLRAIDELSSEEICNDLQISASNLEVLLHRALHDHPQRLADTERDAALSPQARERIKASLRGEQA